MKNGAEDSDSEEESNNGDDPDEDFIRGGDADMIYLEVPCTCCNRTHTTKKNDMVKCDGVDCSNGLHFLCAVPEIKKNPQE